LAKIAALRILDLLAGERRIAPSAAPAGIVRESA